MAMAANNAESEITNATLKSVVHISAPQVAYAQTYSANFYSGSQHFTSLLKTFRETGRCCHTIKLNNVTGSGHRG